MHEIVHIARDRPFSLSVSGDGRVWIEVGAETGLGSFEKQVSRLALFEPAQVLSRCVD